MRHLKYLVLTLTLLGLAMPLAAHAAPQNVFLQNGNSFGNVAVLGTNDNFPLVFETNNTERFRIDDSGLLFTGTFDTSPASVFHVKGGNFLFESADDFMLKAPDYNPLAGINLHYMGADNGRLLDMEYSQTGQPGFSILLGQASGQYSNVGLYISAENGNVSIGEPIGNPEGTLQVLGSTNSTLYIGSSELYGNNPGCLAIGDSDGVGMTYIIANDGALTASATKPPICD
jgi:hypothetical protein